MKTLFSEGKLTKRFGTPSPPSHLLSKRTSPFNKPSISEQLFRDPPLRPNF